MSSEPRRGPDGKFMRKRAVDFDKVREIDDEKTVGKVKKRHVSDDVRFHPVKVEVLEKVIDLAADGEEFVMLSVPTQDHKSGAEGCVVLAAKEKGWCDSGTVEEYKGGQSVYVGAGAIYQLSDDADPDGGGA